MKKSFLWTGLASFALLSHVCAPAGSFGDDPRKKPSNPPPAKTTPQPPPVTHQQNPPRVLTPPKQPTVHTPPSKPNPPSFVHPSRPIPPVMTPPGKLPHIFNPPVKKPPVVVTPPKTPPVVVTQPPKKPPVVEFPTTPRPKSPRDEDVSDSEGTGRPRSSSKSTLLATPPTKTPPVVTPPAKKPPVVVTPPTKKPPVVVTPPDHKKPPVVVTPPTKKPPVVVTPPTKKPPVVVTPPDQKKPPVVVKPPTKKPPVVVTPPDHKKPPVVVAPPKLPFDPKAKLKPGTKLVAVDPGKGKRIDPNTLKIGAGALTAGVIAGAAAQHLLQRPVHDRLKTGQLNNFVHSRPAEKIHLQKQWDLHPKGDIGRQLHLHQNLVQAGGWQHRHFGLIDPGYTRRSLSMSYCGAGFYPKYCWCPHWNPWVQWCWNVCYVPGWWDPRPIYCQPIYIYEPCQPWVVWHYPVWNVLPVVSCGTWVDVPVVQVPQGLDLQLLAVRFVDGGHPEEQQGPRFRVWYRNNSTVDINQPFNIVAYASNERQPGSGPEAGIRVTNVPAGAIQSIDLRLPFAAVSLSQDAQGNPVPFGFLHVIVDAHREIPEPFEENNGSVLARGDILPVDPALFGVDQPAALTGSTISIGGEGFGPEPGQILLRVGDVDLQPKILGWYDLGVQIEIPQAALAGPTSADLVVVRGDQAASNPYTITLQSAGSVSP